MFACRPTSARMKSFNENTPSIRITRKLFSDIYFQRLWSLVGWCCLSFLSQSWLYSCLYEVGWLCMRLPMPMLQDICVKLLSDRPIYFQRLAAPGDYSMVDGVHPSTPNHGGIAVTWSMYEDATACRIWRTVSKLRQGQLHAYALKWMFVGRVRWDLRAPWCLQVASTGSLPFGHWKWFLYPLWKGQNILILYTL